MRLKVLPSVYRCEPHLLLQENRISRWKNITMAKQSFSEIPVLLTTSEAAALLRCAPSSLEVDRCRRRWRVPFLRVGRAIRYDQTAVLRWLADRNPSEMGVD